MAAVGKHFRLRQAAEHLRGSTVFTHPEAVLAQSFVREQLRQSGRDGPLRPTWCWQGNFENSLGNNRRLH
jgi:hypothetical protein